MLKSLQMLDVTTNPNINCMTGGASSATATTTSISLDEDMDPLFDNDWLHEHNLDILFDLFEEEMGNNCKTSGFQDQNFNNSSAFFGSSPVTSYLFGTSPSLASAIDLYDLLYFENQQPINNSTTTQHQSQLSSTNNINVSINSTNADIHTKTYNISSSAPISKKSSDSTSCTPKVVTTNLITNSITNALKIKKKLKKSHNEGVSLLARPNLGNSSCSSNNNISNNNNNITNSNNINNSPKTSSKLTNLKNIYTSSSNGGSTESDMTSQVQPNRNQHHYQNHGYCITGLAVIREHAYALRGH